HSDPPSFPTRRSSDLMFVLGGFFAMMMRLELLTPEGDLLTSDTYNKFFTLHGVVMIFFFLIPVIPAVIGNFILPIMLGAKDLARSEEHTSELQSQSNL